MTLDSQTLLLYAIRLWMEYVSKIMPPLSFKEVFQSYNSREMEKYGNMPEQNVFGVEFRICPID